MRYQFLHTKFVKSVLFSAFFVVFFSALVSTTQAQNVTFAQFFQFPASQHFIFTNNGTSASFRTINGGTPILFAYSNIGFLNSSLQGGQFAHLYITPTTTTAAAIVDGSGVSQPLNQTIVISIVRDTPAPVGVGTGTRTNLLTATISPNTATPDINGSSTSANFTVATPNNLVTFTSDFLSFNLATQRDLSLSFSSVTPSLAISTGSFLRDFTAAGSGTFASNPAPLSLSPTAASVSISGRVLGASGRGVSGVLVTLTEANGTTRTSMTNPFGYYRFLDVAAGQTAILSIISKRYSYTPQVIMVTEDISELNFTAGQ